MQTPRIQVGTDYVAFVGAAVLLSSYKSMAACPSGSPLRMTGSAAAFSVHDFHGLDQDQQVEQQVVILDVVQIVLQLLDGIRLGRSVGIAQLRPASEAR